MGERAPAFPELEPDQVGASWVWPAWVLAGVVGLAIVLRWLHLAGVRDSPFFASLILDARAYDEWAQRIASGDWVGSSAFWVDPLYAYVLGGLYALVGHDLFLARLLNVALGVATVVTVAAIAWRTWGSRLAAVVAALLVALFVPAIHFESQIEKTALTVFLFSLALLLFLIGTNRAIALAGVAVGLATLARGNMLAFVPLAALVLALGWDREPVERSAVSRPQRLRRAALWLGCALPLIALATVHNYAASGKLVPITTNLGINLYLGNHTQNLYGYYDAPDFLTPSTDTEMPDFRKEAQRRSGELLDDAELSSYWARQAWASVVAEPGLALNREIHKVQLALHDDEVPDSEAVELVASWSRVAGAPLLWFGQLLPLAVLGAVVGWRRRSVRTVVAAAAVYLVTLLPFFVIARLRVQVLPPLAVLAGGAVAWIASMITQRRGRSLLWAGLVVGVALIPAYYRPAWMAQRRTSSMAIAWNNLGSVLSTAGRREEAVRAYEHAVEVDAKAVPASLRVLGQYYQSTGDFARAEETMRQVVELRPNSPSARQALRGLYDAMLSDPRWRDDAEIKQRWAALGSAQAPAATTVTATDARTVLARARSLMAEGKTDEAIATLQGAVREGPYNEDLHYILGETMLRHASPAALIEFFSDEVHRDRKPQTSHYFWALGLEQQGDFDGAVAHFKQALEIDPAHEMSQYRWGLLAERQGRLEEALSHLEEATRIHPEFAAALQDAARVADQLGRSAAAEDYRRRAATANFNSPRRFLYWARYLFQHGRAAAALPEIDRMLAAKPGDPEALALREQVVAALGRTGQAPPPVAPHAPTTAWVLTSETLTRLTAALERESSGDVSTIVYDGRYDAASAFARQLAAAFEAAHWTVRLTAAEFPMRPGLFLFAADEPPASLASQVASALNAGSLSISVLTGYRDYAEERRRADSNWQGFTMKPDQSFILAVGRPPG